jgi:tRNA dimethylallyltransferase
LADKRQQIIIVTGPTASGKTEFAIRLANALDAEIVGADSMQVYRGLDIGTAKPTDSELARAPHHLIDCVEIDEPYHVGRYLEDATRAIEEIASRGKRVIVSGGTAMYIKILLEGLVEGPGRDDAIRAELEERWGLGEGGLLWEELSRCDPQTASRLHPNDRSRIIRALEVWRSTGQSLTTLHEAQEKIAHRYDALIIGMQIERASLYSRINRRVELMLEAGWLEEVRSVLAKGYSPELPPLCAIGYRQLCGYLLEKGEPSEGGELEAVAEEIKRETRRFAKRQMTWFRKLVSNWLEPTQVAEAVELVKNFLQ